ncbi:MAG: dockerin type I domain-containing protein [Armatimonadota bacterium]
MPMAVSADGTIVVGYSQTANREYHAFRWTLQSGIQPLGNPFGSIETGAMGISADGRVIVGRAVNPDWTYRAFYWTQATGMVDIGGTGYSWAWSANPDGTILVGMRFFLAYRWQWTGSAYVGTYVGDLGGGRGFANALTPNGQVIVGWSANRANQERAFRWVAGHGMEELGTLGGSSSTAWDVSADGSVVVGWAMNAAGNLRPYRWSADTRQMIDLGDFGGTLGEARAVTADGRAVVGGTSAVGNAARAFIWTTTRGLQDLNVLYTSVIPPNSVLWKAMDISPDGRYIVGEGYNAERGHPDGFWLDTWRTGDTNGDGCIDDTDLLAVLFAFGTGGSGYTRHEDINKDGIVDDSDLLTVLFSFGQGC